MVILPIKNSNSLNKKEVILNKRDFIIKEANLTQKKLEDWLKPIMVLKIIFRGFIYYITIKRKIQTAALNALRYGIESYDKRHGWRGPITNTKKN